MITPAYSPTATERVLPRMALDFTTASLDPRVTVTRALNTATAINSSGLIVAVNANLPRFDYDPVTFVPKGLLIEEQRANSFIFSEEFDNGNWNKINATVNANATTAPTGASTADALVENTTNGSHGVQQFVSFTSGLSYTISYYVKAGTRSWVRIYLPSAAFAGGAGSFYNLSGAGALGASNGTFTGRSITAVGNGWYRITLTAAATSTAGGNTGIVAGVADNNSSYIGVAGAEAFYLWGAQLEAGAFATSYIANLTTGSTTRNADVVSMTGTNFSNWYNSTSGAILVRSRQFVITGTRPSIYISDGTANNIISLRGSAANPELYIKATTDQVQIDAGTLIANSSFGLVGAWATDNCAAAINGEAAVTDTSATIPTVDQMLIGSDGTNYLNGHVERISYWPQRIINAEAQAFSK